MKAAVSLQLPDDFVAQVVEEAVARVREELLAQSAPWLNVRSAATYLDCSERRIYDLVEQGRLDAMRDGRRLLFRRQWLDAALDPKV